MKRAVIDFVDDILAAIDDIQQFTNGLDFEAFSQDKKTIYAVTHVIEIIGEAVKNIPQSIRDKYPHIPWKQAAGMRDKLIHGYFSVNLLTIWKAATQDVPQLKNSITEIKRDLEANDQFS